MSSVDGVDKGSFLSLAKGDDGITEQPGQPLWFCGVSSVFFCSDQGWSLGKFLKIQGINYL